MSEPKPESEFPPRDHSHDHGRNQEREREMDSSPNQSDYTDEKYASEAEDEGSDGGFAPIKPEQSRKSAVDADRGTRPQRPKRNSTTSRSIERSWSLNDGYSCHSGHDAAAGIASDVVHDKAGDEGDGGDESVESDDYVVEWEENDPACPRNFRTPRRWAIVLICSTGSLCVYVFWLLDVEVEVEVLIDIGLVRRRFIR